MPSASINNRLAATLIAVTCLSFATRAESIEDARDVEIGAGGNVRPEKPYRTELEEQFDWHAHLLWESRYVTEGRDNLAGKSIASISTEFTYRNLGIIPWFARGIGADYREFNLNLVYGIHTLDNLEIFLGYNRLLSREQGTRSTDNEFSIDLAWLHSSKVQLQASIYHSFDAGGEFLETTIIRNIRLDSPRSISVSGSLGFNAGYVTDGHNGLNHGQLRVRLSHPLSADMGIYASMGYNIALRRDSAVYPGDGSLRNFFWGGAGFTARF